MRCIHIVGFCFAIAVFSPLASAQIIAQTPRPEIITPDDITLETIKRDAPIGRADRGMQVPRAGALLFAGFDSNGDYTIDRAEVTAGIARSFENADADKSGALSLVELEGWRLRALGFENATPTNYAFAPNFSGKVTRAKFVMVLNDVADKLDTDEQGQLDGRIAYSDLLKSFTPRRAARKDDNCISRIREERRRTEQQCRNSRR